MKICYVNIERVCLSVCFGLKKFHTYLYGRHVIVQNEHKLLEMIQQKPIHAVPPHLQCMLFHMQKHNYTIHYKPSKEMVLADHRSHVPSLKESIPILFTKTSSMYSCLLTSWMPSEEPWNVTHYTTHCTT